MKVTSMRVAPIGVSASANGALTLREESTSMQVLPMRVLCMILLIASGAATANPNVPPPPQAEPIYITNAVIHTVSGATFADGHMLFSEGRITAVGASEIVEPNARVIDLGGRHVYPGLISAHTALGLVEISAVRATIDVAEPGLVNPNVRTEVAVNPDSELIPVARANGVLAALTVPSGGLIRGTSAVIQLDGWTWEDMTLKAPVGMHIEWPVITIPGDVDAEREEQLTEAREERVGMLEDSLEAAAAYRTARESGEPVDLDLRWEAMIPVFDGSLPVFAHAQDLPQIRHAMHLAEEYGLNLILVGGADAWRVADQLAERDIPVIVSNVLRLPLRRWEDYDTPYANPAKLAEAGVTFSIATPGGTFAAGHVRDLPNEAAMAVAYGLDAEEAVKAVTLYPAQILGVDDRLGSLEAGKDATFIVTDGNPLDIRTQVERAFVQGRELDLSSRHTTLYEKYSERLDQIEDSE